MVALHYIPNDALQRVAPDSVEGEGNHKLPALQI